jgi:hypothetical protein
MREEIGRERWAGEEGEGGTKKNIGREGLRKTGFREIKGEEGGKRKREVRRGRG